MDTLLVIILLLLLFGGGGGLYWGFGAGWGIGPIGLIVLVLVVVYLLYGYRGRRGPPLPRGAPELRQPRFGLRSDVLEPMGATLVPGMPMRVCSRKTSIYVRA